MKAGLRWPLACAALVWLVAVAPAFAATRHVVLLYDERTDLPGLSVLDASLVRALTSNSPDPIEIYREAMDRSRFGSDAHVLNLRDYLSRKYAGRNVDAVIAVMGPALDFLLSHGDQVFPGTPIVFCGIDRRELGNRALPDRVTGVLLRREFAPTLDLALALHPRTTSVAVVAGTSEFDKRLIEQARGEFRAYEDRVTFNYLTDLPLSALLRKVSRLPPRTIVLYSTMFRDAAGEALVPHKVATRLSAAANAPVYGFVDQYLGRGIVGGHLYTLDTHGEQVARLTLEILAGADPATLPLIERGAGEDLFDARQLERWRISDRQLPPGSTVLFRDPSLWNEYRTYIMGVAVVVTLQALAIGGLLTQRARRRRLESELRASESLFRDMADTAPVMIWIAAADGQFEFLNSVWLDFTGESLPEALHSGWTNHVHPDDLPRWRSLYETRPGCAGFTTECRLRRHDGTYRWMLCAAVPRLASPEHFVGYVGSCVDISPLREAELENQRQLAELSHVSRVASLGQLTASVAHELNQPLTGIMINSDAAQKALDAASPSLDEVHEILTDILMDGRRAAEIIRRMRSLLQKHEIARKPVDVDEAVREVIQLLRPEALERKVVLGFDPNAKVSVSGDYVHLQQVIMNLVLNGFEATSATEESRRRVSVRTEITASRAVAITVTDTGRGIRPDALTRLFEPFYTTKRNGLGMGLAIARSIIEAHGGSVLAENNAGGGATFCVSLPVLTAGMEPASAAPGRAQRAPAIAHGRTRLGP